MLGTHTTTAGLGGPGSGASSPWGHRSPSSLGPGWVVASGGSSWMLTLHTSLRVVPRTLSYSASKHDDKA